ncbi:hypothetical protein HS088_TW08G00997 [Tripterygium wilfordii]|uniref:Erythronate-4-phosphate dehydrogenase family protein n=1 Tax=Tripterygium wilfordii TaxID=458696 RepID=A0A7J7DDI1_TRIWF|nr:uncharacterized protein At1g01500-like [Tripterygium wilfordii]KAF5744392.1 hypothetical protein HS088_TW08G00997 [Tripterygium wilfordii]
MDDNKEKVRDLTVSIPKTSNSYHLIPNPSLNQSSWLEIRLFYVRIAPCVMDSVPDHLTLCHFRREIGVSLEINGSYIPAADSASLTLRRDRLNKDYPEVTYVSTDGVRVTGSIEFEVLENEDMILCGSLERMESTWGNGTVGLEIDSRTGWSMDCYMTAGIGAGSSAFFQPRLGVSAPAIEIYIAGCCGGVPVILTKTIQVSPRRKGLRHGTLDAIPEDEEFGREQKGGNVLVRHSKVQITETDADTDAYDMAGKIGNSYYSEEMYTGEDGQLSWFNAGVRVGVGIGLGMCLGVGIGVGLLMRSYQATTRNFRRRFL